MTHESGDLPGHAARKASQGTGGCTPNPDEKGTESYGLARLLGDVSAASKGPKAALKRLGRRAGGRPWAGRWGSC